jgi:hypothetical protein
VGRAKETRVAVKNTAKAQASRNGAGGDEDDAEEVVEERQAKPTAAGPRVSVRKSAPGANGRGDR